MNPLPLLAVQDIHEEKMTPDVWAMEQMMGIRNPGRTFWGEDCESHF